MKVGGRGESENGGLNHLCMISAAVQWLVEHVYSTWQPRGGALKSVKSLHSRDLAVFGRSQAISQPEKGRQGANRHVEVPSAMLFLFSEQEFFLQASRS